MYWNTILNEVLNKRNKSYPFLFTNVNETVEESESEIKSKQLRKQKPHPFPLGENYPNVYFSAREVECALLFLQGKTILQTGKSLHLSPRTVEFYLNNMKRKLNCRLKSELIGKMMESDLRNKL